MRRPLTLMILALVAFTRPAVVFGQARWPLDLANPPATVTVSVPAGSDVSLRTVNRLPTKRYVISVQLETIPIEPLTAIAIPQAAACQAVTDVDQIDKQADETALGALVAKIRDEVGSCTQGEQSIVTRALNRTEQTIPGRWTIHAGEQLTVTITRADDAARKWVFVLTAGSRGSWRTLYGVSLASNKDDHYFLKPGTTTGTFVVTHDRPQTDTYRDLKVIPSVFFSWLSHSKELSDLSISPTLGFGVKDDRPGFFFGASFVYNQNLGIVVGIPVYHQLRLKGQYSEGQTVSDNLSEDQLHDKQYRFGKLFLAGVFRFGSNPFSNDPKPAQKEAAPTETPAKKSDGSDGKKDGNNQDSAKPAADKKGNSAP